MNLGDKFDTSKVTEMSEMFINTGLSNPYFVLDLSGFTFDNVTSYTDMIKNFSSTKIIYVTNEAQQSWILDKGFANLSTSNVLIKS